MTVLGVSFLDAPMPMWLVAILFGLLLSVGTMLISDVSLASKALALPAVWLLAWGFFPYPSPVFVITMTAVPWLTLAAVALSRGRLQLSQDGRGSDRPDATALILAPAAALVVVLRNDDAVLIEGRGALITGCLVSIVLCATFLLVRRPDPDQAGSLWFAPAARFPRVKAIAAFFALLTLGVAYGYAVAAFADMLADTRPATSYTVKVTAKRSEPSRGSPKLYITVAPWPLAPHGELLRVDKTVYDAVRPGQSVCFDAHPGRFGWRWQRLHLCR